MMKKIKMIWLITALSSFSCAEHNVEFPEYQFNKHAWETIDHHISVYIAPLELLSGKQPYDLTDVFRLIDSEIAFYLKNHGFNVLPSDEFSALLKHHLRNLEDVAITPTDKDTYIHANKCIEDALAEWNEQHEISIVILPVALLGQLPLNPNYNASKWDGVKRFERYKMHWPVRDTLSVGVSVALPNGQVIFKGRGGIDFTQKLIDNSTSSTRKMKKSSLKPKRFSLIPKETDDYRKRDIFEGIEIAFYPFIESKRIKTALNK